MTLRTIWRLFDYLVDQWSRQGLLIWVGPEGLGNLVLGLITEVLKVVVDELFKEDSFAEDHSLHFFLNFRLLLFFLAFSRWLTLSWSLLTLLLHCFRRFLTFNIFVHLSQIYLSKYIVNLFHKGKILVLLLTLISLRP
jgi:hypothetical protein